MTVIALSALNSLSNEDAVATLGGVFEHSPWIVSETWARAPFASVADLHRELMVTVLASPVGCQLALIRAHPDLVGRAAREGTLTRESTAEQRAAGLGPDDLTDDDRASFARLNDAYQATFGFPFVICARENKKASILAGFAARMANDPATERQTALHEIERIAWFRLHDLVVDD